MILNHHGIYRMTQKKKQELLKCVVASLRNRDVELQTTPPFSNHASVEWSLMCFHHKNVL